MKSPGLGRAGSQAQSDVRASRGVALVAYIATVWVVTLAPLPSGAYRAISFPAFDKVVHVGLFGGLALLLCWALNASARPRAVVIVGLASVMAGLIEVVQGLLPYRSAEWWDLLAGVAGALAGTVLAAAIASRASGAGTGAGAA